LAPCHRYSQRAHLHLARTTGSRTRTSACTLAGSQDQGDDSLDLAGGASSPASGIGQPAAGPFCSGVFHSLGPLARGCSFSSFLGVLVVLLCGLRRWWVYCRRPWFLPALLPYRHTRRRLARTPLATAERALWG
jgi:hypothetical protein